MFFSLFSFILSSSNISKANITSDEIMEQMRDGKKFTDIVDTSDFQYFTDFDVDRFLEILNGINVPRRSCYNDVLYKLQFDCEKANEEQQKILSLHFTQCYFNITGKIDQFPIEVIDTLKTSAMSQSVYSIYTSMKTHWKNLCRFSKQTVFTEQTSHSLVDLYQSIIQSINSILSLQKELNETSNILMESFTNITAQLENNYEKIGVIQVLFDSFSGYFEPIIKYIKFATDTMKQMKFFSLVLIITLFFATYIPKMILPVSITTVIFFFLDRLIGNHCSIWENSIYRKIFFYIYAFACFSYPAYLIFKYIVKIFKFLISLAKKDKKEKENNNKQKEKENGSKQKEKENSSKHNFKKIKK